MVRSSPTRQREVRAVPLLAGFAICIFSVAMSAEIDRKPIGYRIKEHVGKSSGEIQSQFIFMVKNRDPNWAETFDYGIALVNAGEFSRARSLFETSAGKTRYDNERAASYLCAAQCASVGGDFQWAGKLANLAAELVPGDPHTQQMRLGYWISLGDCLEVEIAKESLSKADQRTDSNIEDCGIFGAILLGGAAGTNVAWRCWKERRPPLPEEVSYAIGWTLAGLALPEF